MSLADDLAATAVLAVDGVSMVGSVGTVARACLDFFFLEPIA